MDKITLSEFGAMYDKFVKRMCDFTLSTDYIEGAKKAFALAYLNLEGTEGQISCAAVALETGLRYYERALTRAAEDGR